jgi:hypothetical protein
MGELWIFITTKHKILLEETPFLKIPLMDVDLRFLKNILVFERGFPIYQTNEIEYLNMTYFMDNILLQIKNNLDPELNIFFSD